MVSSLRGSFVHTRPPLLEAVRGGGLADRVDLPQPPLTRRLVVVSGEVRIPL